jgi:hypothetical protein
MKEYPLAAFTFEDTEYSPGLIRVDEEHSGGELLLYRKKSFLSKTRQVVNVTKFSYDSKTEISVKQATVVVGRLSIRLESEQHASELFRLFIAPLALEHEKSLSELRGPIRGFLVRRGEGLALVGSLRTDPRSALVRNRRLIPEDPADPLKALLEAFMKQLSEQLEEVQAVLDRAPERVRARLSETIYDLTCALCAIQNSSLEGDERGARAAMRLLTSIVPVPAAEISASGAGSTTPAGPDNAQMAATSSLFLLLDRVLAGLKDMFVSRGLG